MPGWAHTQSSIRSGDAEVHRYCTAEYLAVGLILTGDSAANERIPMPFSHCVNGYTAELQEDRLNTYHDIDTFDPQIGQMPFLTFERTGI